jgi:antitoxin CptB
MNDQQTEFRRKKLLHRARYRGFKEADILVGGFAEEALADMSDAALDAFEKILAESDHDIYAWVTGARDAPAEIDAKLIARMRLFDAARKAQSI